jgi:hypothetical protein
VDRRGMIGSRFLEPGDKVQVLPGNIADFFQIEGRTGVVGDIVRDVGPHGSDACEVMFDEYDFDFQKQGTGHIKLLRAYVLSAELLEIA